MYVNQFWKSIYRSYLRTLYTYISKVGTYIVCLLLIERICLHHLHFNITMSAVFFNQELNKYPLWFIRTNIKSVPSLGASLTIIIAEISQ